MTQPLRIAVITASVREGRGGPIFGSWMAEQAEAYGGLDVELIDLADHEIPLSLPAESPKAAGDDYPRPEGQADLTDALAAAEGFVIVTPEYNHSYPASLKSALDWHFTQWQAKPVALVSYGGDSGGRHAALHLENVLTELHAHPLQARLAFPRYWERLDENGRPNDPDSAVYAKACSPSSPGGPRPCGPRVATRPIPGETEAPRQPAGCRGARSRTSGRRQAATVSLTGSSSARSPAAEAER